MLIICMPGCFMTCSFRTKMFYSLWRCVPNYKTFGQMQDVSYKLTTTFLLMMPFASIISILFIENLPRFAWSAIHILAVLPQENHKPMQLQAILIALKVVALCGMLGVRWVLCAVCGYLHQLFQNGSQCTQRNFTPDSYWHGLYLNATNNRIRTYKL